MRFAIVSLVLILVIPPTTAGPLDDNKAVARRIFEEILTGGNFELASQLYAADFVNHGRNRDADLAEDQGAARAWRQAFPDLVIKPEIVLAENDLVAVVWQARGTNSAAAKGLPATGRSVRGRGITIWRISGGKVREEWSEFSELALLQQLGILPGGVPIYAASSMPLAPELPAGSTSRAVRKANRALVTSALEQILGAGRLSLVETMYSKTFVNHGLRGEGGIQNEIDGTTTFRKLAADMKVEVTRTIAEGNLVAAVYTAGGTNSGEAMGYPPTGRPFKVRAMAVMRVSDGRIAEEWSVFDPYQALQQLGLFGVPNQRQ